MRGQWGPRQPRGQLSEDIWLWTQSRWSFRAALSAFICPQARRSWEEIWKRERDTIRFGFRRKIALLEKRLWQGKCKISLGLSSVCRK